MFRAFFPPRLPTLLLLAVCLVGGAVRAAEAPRVVVGIKPIHSLLSALMQGVAEPTLLVDGDADPYRYTLQPDQQEILARADLLVWVGEELEGFLAQPVAAGAIGGRVLELLADDELKVLPAVAEPSRRDPFFWLDSRNALILVDQLTRELVALDPSHESRYLENRARLVERISAVDRRMEYGYRGVSAVPIALYHGTQRYFEQAYAASVEATVSHDPGQVPDTSSLLQARGTLAERGIGCLFTEAGLPAPYLDLLTAGLDLKVAQLDSLGTRLAPGPDLYLDLITGNFDTIAACVGAANSAHGLDGPVPGDLSGRFMLVDHHGNTVTNHDYLGDFTLITFGYTFCPDVCPTALATVAGVMKRLGDEAERVRPLFITVDPQRDTVEVLRQYVGYFHPRLVGLTGPQAMIDHTVRDFGARYEKVPGPSPSEYSIDHTAGFYLFGPDGRFLAKLGHGLTPQQMVQRLGEFL